MAWRRNKYGNVKTEFDGILFDSKREAERYVDLILLLRGGAISDLELQPNFKLEVAGKKVCSYRADFRYTENGAVIVEDVKGMKTPVYKLKVKLLKALHPNLDFREV